MRKEELRQKNRPTTPQAFPPDSDSDDEGFTCDDFPHFFVHRPGHLRLFCDYVMNYDQRGKTRNICTTLVELLVDEWRSLKDTNGSDELLEQKSEDIMALLRSDAPYDRMVALVLVETREFPCDLGVPRCCGAFTPSTRIVSRRWGRGWFLFGFWGCSDRVERPRRRVCDTRRRHRVHAGPARCTSTRRSSPRNPSNMKIARSPGGLVDKKDARRSFATLYDRKSE